MARQRPFKKFAHSPKMAMLVLTGLLLVALWFFSGRYTGYVPSGALQSSERDISDEQEQLGGLVDDKSVNEDEDGPSTDDNLKPKEEASSDDQSGKDGDEEEEAEREELKGGVVENKKVDEDVKRTSGATQSLWKLCSSPDYIPCLDNEEAIKMLPGRHHFEHRERHCPKHEDMVNCLVPLPAGYKRPVPWPKSRDEIWFDNVPHPGLVSYKQDQSWVKRSGDKLIFPGTGTQFVLGAGHYIDYIQRSLMDIEWGKHIRVVLDVGCGVASFGGYLFQKDVLTMSFAPKDEHEAQVQFALERGIPAISAVMGTQRLVYPANVFDMVHCARCRVPWHADGGKLLLEVNRVLRPGGYFVWSAPPVYRKQEDQVEIWKNTSSVAAAMCWNQVARTMDNPSGIGAAIFQKPRNNDCYEHRRRKHPPLCDDGDVRDAAWYVPMKSCIHKVPVGQNEHGSRWPKAWPERLETPPSWLTSFSKGIYGKPMLDEFISDTQHWKHVIQNSYLKSLKLDWRGIRNIMDMKAAYGGFAAALSSQPVWVMNVVPVYEPDTLAVIFDRGLFGMYHDWCESFSTYPRTYDLVHADHLLTRLNSRCNATLTFVEMDRILRPGGYIILRDKVDNLKQFKPVMDSLNWKVHLSHTQGTEELLVLQKQWWRPQA